MKPGNARRRIYFGALGALALAIGCNPPPATKPTTEKEPGTRAADEALAAAINIFRRDHGIKPYRNALAQLNSHLARPSESRAKPLTEEQRELLTRKIGLEEEELREVESSTYTPLDAYYLDQCFLLRDAARSVGVTELPPLQRAEKVFAWVVRQVGLRDGPSDDIPTAFVLRRGWGTPAQRAFVFLGMLEQLGLDGCVVAIPATVNGQFPHFWAAGVLIDKEIYLFDFRLGLPLPGSGKDKIATLSQVRAGGKEFEALSIDEKHKYDVSAGEARQADVYLGWSLSALSPRMKALEDMLGSSSRVVLSRDPAALAKKFSDTVGSKVHLEASYNYLNPTRVLRSFLLPDEGGTDTANRRPRFDSALFPIQALPPSIWQIPSGKVGSVTLTNLANAAFAALFSQFPVPSLSQNAAQRYDERPDQVVQRTRDTQDPRKTGENADDLRQRVIDYLRSSLSPKGVPPEHFLLAAHSFRDEILRGRYDEATLKLVEARDQVQAQIAMVEGRPNFSAELAKWTEDIRQVLQEIVEAGQSGRSNDDALGRWSALWTGDPGSSDRLPVWLLAVLKASARPLGEEATFQLALCKHEQAERMQVRFDRGQKNSAPDKAWETAGQWWQTYLSKYPSSKRIGAARVNLARVKEALNDRAGAASLLRAPDSGLTAWEQLGALYRAEQLLKH